MRRPGLRPRPGGKGVPSPGGGDRVQRRPLPCGVWGPVSPGPSCQGRSFCGLSHKEEVGLGQGGNWPSPAAGEEEERTPQMREGQGIPASVYRWGGPLGGRGSLPSSSLWDVKFGHRRREVRAPSSLHPHSPSGQAHNDRRPQNSPGSPSRGGGPESSSPGPGSDSCPLPTAPVWVSPDS